MATRATYQLPGGYNGHLNITYYIHYDGYPSGAAWRFWKMYNRIVIEKRIEDMKIDAYQKLATGKGSIKSVHKMPDREMSPNAFFAETFILANPECEFTQSHEAHNDTEYRYSLYTKGEDICIKVRKREEIGLDLWDLMFEGPLYEFINEYVENPTVETLTIEDFKELVITE